MRHIRTLIVAIVVAPLAWVLLALGQARSLSAFPGTGHGTPHAGDFVKPVLLLAAAGLLLGILATLRVSPLGAMAIGIVYTLSYTMLLAAPSQVVNLSTHDLWVIGHQVDLAAPIRTGTTMVVGVLLLVATASAQRWRRWPSPVGPMDEERPLGTDGLGLTPRFGDTELEPLPVRYPTTPAPYTTLEPNALDTWTDASDESPLPARTSATRAAHRW
ncbi:hypothetical protein [Dactylosporangium sp. CA-233914]|uniref:hypothetical protein n=1 Tax=Dactylosporangium sp. CA-233914 TaxID=3239934 RepID=UPI003D922F51